MKNIVLLFSIFFFSFFSAQQENRIFGNKKPFEQVDQLPEYPGGESAFLKELYQNIPLKTGELAKDYSADLFFMIEKDGTYTNVKTSGEDSSFNAMVSNALKKMKTSWKSAENEGKKVRYQVVLDVSLNRTPKGTGSRRSIFGKKKEDPAKATHPARFPGGPENFRMLILQNLNGETKGYFFTLNFYVQRDGMLSDIKVSGENEEKNKLIENAVKEVKERWIPGQIKGLKIKNRMQLRF